MPVNRCVCFNVSFEELKKILDENKLETIKELQEKKEFGLHCGMCLAFVKEMIETGNTSFELY